MLVANKLVAEVWGYPVTVGEFHCIDFFSGMNLVKSLPDFPCDVCDQSIIMWMIGGDEEHSFFYLLHVTMVSCGSKTVSLSMLHVSVRSIHVR